MNKKYILNHFLRNQNSALLQKSASLEMFSIRGKWGINIPSRLVGATLGGGFLWNDGALLTHAAGSPFAANVESVFCLKSLILPASESVCLSWRLAGLDSTGCLGGGSLGPAGAQVIGLVRFRGLGLAETSPSMMELSFWPSVGKETILRVLLREFTWYKIMQISK